MLLSQRIAIDKNCIEPADNALPHMVKGERNYIKMLRPKIMRATKLIVPNEFLNLQGDGRATTLMPEGSKLAPRHPLYKEYARLFAPTMFIENEHGGILLEELPVGWVATTLVVRPNTGGTLCQLNTCRIVFDRTKNVDQWLTELPFILEGKMVITDYPPKKPETHRDLMTLMSIICEILLFTNTKNTPSHSYTPSANELSGVPKDVLPRYTYKVLDIYRDLKKADSIETIKTFIRTVATDNGHRRAHLVRGHFKRKKNGLFWWSPFLRARESAAKLGVVVKNYNLKVKE